MYSNKTLSIVISPELSLGIIVKKEPTLVIVREGVPEGDYDSLVSNCMRELGFNLR